MAWQQNGTKIKDDPLVLQNSYYSLNNYEKCGKVKEANSVVAQ